MCVWEPYPLFPFAPDHGPSQYNSSEQPSESSVQRQQPSSQLRPTIGLSKRWLLAYLRLVNGKSTKDIAKYLHDSTQNTSYHINTSSINTSNINTINTNVNMMTKEIDQLINWPRWKSWSFYSASFDLMIRLSSSAGPRPLPSADWLNLVFCIWGQLLPSIDDLAELRTPSVSVRSQSVSNGRDSSARSSNDSSNRVTQDVAAAVVHDSMMPDAALKDQSISQMISPIEIINTSNNPVITTQMTNSLASDHQWSTKEWLALSERSALWPYMCEILSTGPSDLPPLFQAALILGNNNNNSNHSFVDH